jgi:large subunit ribosomal protein L31
MKDKIHPKLNKVIFIDVMSKAEFVATSTLTSDETKKIDGIEHYVIKVETSSASHPFYTGKRRQDVKNDQVAKFLARVATAQEKNKPIQSKKEEGFEEELVNDEPIEEPKKKKKTTTAKKSATKKASAKTESKEDE